MPSVLEICDEPETDTAGEGDAEGHVSLRKVSEVEGDADTEGNAGKHRAERRRDVQ